MTDPVTTEQAEEALHLDPLPPNSPWWTVYFVANKKDIFKQASTWMIALAAAIPMIQEAIPNLHLGETTNHYVTIVLGVLAIAVKFVNQQPTSKE